MAQAHGAPQLADPRDNLILAGLSCRALERLRPTLQPLALEAGHHLPAQSHDGRPLFHFIGRGVVTLLYTTADGESAEIGLIGRDGGVGLGYVFSAYPMPGERVVQLPGCGWSVDAAVMRREFARGGSLQRMMLAFGQALTVQIAQTSVCNRHHTVERQFIRWVLLSLDRLTGADLTMTQESIARMLGVRRAGVSETAGRLRAQGLLELSRGRIHVNDRTGLEERACECYRVIRDQYAQLLPGLGSINRHR